jgi:Zn-dependent protease with chaperone function
MEKMEPRSVSPETPITAYTLSPPLREKAEAHAHAKHFEYAAGTIWGILILFLILRLRLSARFQTIAERAGRKFFQACVFAPLFLLTMAALQLPLDIWSQITERKFGLSIQGWGSFARDWLIGQIIAVLLGTFLIWLIYAVMRRAPRRWWLWAWAAVMPVLLFVVFIEPFVIEPLFFKFSALAARDPALATQLHAIAAHGGQEIPVDRMFVMDASEKLRSVNAYVTGFAASKRVVVWDTTLAEMTPREISFVFGHELGHYVLHHIVYGLMMGAIGLLFAFWLAAQVIGGLIKRFGKGWGIARINEYSSLPVLLLVVTLLSTVSTPIGAAVSRTMEHQADAFGLKTIEGVVDDPPQAAAHAFQRLGEIDLAQPDPSPLVVFWLYDHPAIRDRVQFVLTSKAGGGRSE